LLSSESFKDVPVLFITVDPQRDTTERLRDYTSFFHPNIKGLRGRVAQIDAVSAAYGTFYRFGSDKEEGSNEYTVDHSAYVYLLNADGELVRVFDHDVKSDEISELLHKLL
jgi:protein SCO1/2